MDKKLIEKTDMGVSFDGIITLLAENLYSDSNVFIRELVQNAHDAIQKRRAIDKDLAGRIEVNINKSNSTISCSDNGIGMNDIDLKKHLATIGESETRLKKLKREDNDLANSLIGQFGIGLLSSFIVAKKVVVRTKKISNDKSYEWHNSGSLKCELYEDNLENTGSEIILYLKNEYDYLLDEKRIVEIIKKYCDFIPFPISLNGKGPINEIDVPIYKKHWNNDEEKKAEYALFINRRYQYNDIPLDIIPFNISGEYSAKGVLFLSAHRMPNDSTGIIDIFSRRMFIKDNDSSLLPEWAKFIRGVIDSPDLQPTASRDNIKINHPSYEYLKAQLGKVIVERLIEISEKSSEKFEKINQWHHYHLKGMACKYLEFFDKVKDLLLFETNQGFMTLPEYFLKNERKIEYGNKKPIYYFPYQSSSTLFNTLANENGLTVINAGGIYDEEFLEIYEKNNSSDSVLINLNYNDGDLFSKLTNYEEKKYIKLCFDVEKVLNEVLNKTKVVVRIRKFAPSRLPSVIINDKDDERNKQLEQLAKVNSLFGGIDLITKEFLKTERERTLYLNLNSLNELTNKLTEIEDSSNEEIKDIYLGLFTTAIIYSQNNLSEHNTNIIYDQFVSLFSKLLKFQDKIYDKQKLLEEHRFTINELNKKITEVEQGKSEEWWNAPVMNDEGHFVFFVIMPFKKEFNNFFEAIKLVFECYPYYFEVIRADEKTFSETILENIIEHYKRANGFIIEFSEPNPNVFYELGTLSSFEHKRVLLKFRNADADELPADLRGILYIKYSSKDKAPIELAEEIKRVLYKDGRFTNHTLNNLLQSRKKRYLSRKLLENDIILKLTTKQVETILKHYRNIEDFINGDTSIIYEELGLTKAQIEVIKNDLNNHCK